MRKFGATVIRRTKLILSKRGTLHTATTECEQIVDATRNVSFSGSGFLCVFHLGVASALIERKIVTDGSRFAGASGGALVAAALGSNLSIKVVLESLLYVAAECRKHGTIGHVGKPLMQALEKLVPKNGAELCNGRVKVAVSCVWPKFQSPILVDNFVDRNDLLLALKSSCFIPYYLDRDIGVRWREGYYVDGGFVQFVPAVPSHLFVMVFPHKYLGQMLPKIVRKSKDMISPSLLQDFPYSMQDLMKRSLIPSSETDLLKLYEWGRKIGLAWADAQDQR
jgi:hypothetical protein